MMRGPGRVTRALSLVAVLSLTSGLPAAVVVSAIMYSPPEGRDGEYLEIFNGGAEVVDLSGWKFTDGIEYTFPSVQIGPSQFLILARSPEEMPGALGPYDGALENRGERVTLVDASGEVVESFAYDNEPPWDWLADGFGALLARRCFAADPNLPENWLAVLPGAGGTFRQCPPEPLSRPPLYISEIMYHPVLEESLDDEHEFIEIHNASDQAVSLGGWRIAGGVDFAFPEGASIGPGEYRVIARNREALAAVAAYGLSVEDLFGDYEGTLDNGGERVALISDEPMGVDLAVYDDDFPWPVAADALGAGTSWLPSELLPLEEHRHMGHSLERVSFEFPTSDAANWEASPLDGATPGRPNASAREVPLPAVDGILVRPSEGEGELIRQGDEVRLQVSFSPSPPGGAVELEYFVEDIALQGEDTVVTGMFDDGAGGGDFFAGDGIYTAMLPSRADNTIVRYRIRADRGNGMETVSPRPSDPNDWHAYFVSPVIPSTTRTYHLFISPANWGRMWSNVSPGRAGGCSANPNWNAKVEAVFVHEGRVHDVKVRYQGSRWNRTNGRDIRIWPYPRPSTGPLRALSWRMSFPRYNQLEGRSVTVLNKLQQSCPGYNSGVGYRLFAMADLPAPQTRFVRFHVNGGYYHYMMEYERPGEEMMERYHREMAEKYPDRPREELGHLYKSAGCTCDEGPYGWGDMRLLPARCGYTVEERYAATYDRKIHEWADYQEFMTMIEALHQARRGGVDSMRQYFADFFDLDLLLSYMAIINYQVPFDDMFQNFFLYQRRSDGKWLMTPWDLDRNFGEWAGARSSIFLGEAGNPDNRSGWWNYLKDAFLKSYRTEFQERLLLLNNTLLHPDNISALVDQVTEEANPAEAQAAPAGGLGCSFPGRAAGFKNYALVRHAFINETVAGAAIDAGPDRIVFAGETVQFDARDSRPDPGPETPYAWDNGMEGDFPTFVFEEPGVFTVTLTVTVLGIPFQDSVTVTVMAVPDRGFVESGGPVVMEAESHFMIDPHATTDVAWTFDSARQGFSGAGYMEAEEITRRRTFLSRHSLVAPEMRYAILFENAGTYRVWVRGFVSSSGMDTLHVNLNGAERASGFALQFGVDEEAFQWAGVSRREGPHVVDVTEPGLRFLSVWMRESGILVDKIIITPDLDFVPEGSGPPESATRPLDGEGAFLRGDVDGDGRLSVSDAIGVLFFLFRGASSLSCEDHGDVDDSGRLELTDAIRLLDFLFHHGDPPAAPFPESGFDETPDGYECGSP